MHEEHTASVSAEQPSHRLFIGCPIPEREAEILRVWTAHAFQPHAVRTVPAENMHVTVAFLGACTPERRAELAKAVAEASWIPLAVTTNGMAYLHGNANAVGLQADTVAVERQLALLGLDREDRHLRLHITVARSIPGHQIAPKFPLPSLSFALDRLALYESFPSPEGSSYIIVSHSGGHDRSPGA